jgi:hypothetical protein
MSQDSTSAAAHFLPFWKRALTSTLAMAAVALVLRLIAANVIYWDLSHRGYHADGTEIGCVARSVALGEGFHSPFPFFENTGPTAIVPPVYTYFVAGLYKIFGVWTRQAFFAAIYVNCLLAALTVFPLVGLGRRVFGERVALVTGWVWVLFPTMVMVPAKWVWETSLSALLLTWGLERAYALRDSEQLRAWGFFGALCGFCALTNPAMASPLPLAGAWAARGLARDAKNWLRPAAAAALLLALVMLPWTIRNFMVFGKIIPVRSNFGLQLFLGNNPEVVDNWTFWLHPTLNIEEYRRYAALGEIAYFREKQAIAMRFVREHPWIFLKLSLNRFVWFWTGTWDAMADVWAGGRWKTSLHVTAHAALGITGLLGLLLAVRRRVPGLEPVGLAYLIYPIVYYIAHPIVRFRHPVDPLLILTTVFALDLLFRKADRAS